MGKIGGGVHSWETKTYLNTTTDAAKYSPNVLQHDSVTASQHAQQQDLETEAAKWDSSITILLFTSVLFLLQHVKMSFWKKSWSLGGVRITSNCLYKSIHFFTTCRESNHFPWELNRTKYLLQWISPCGQILLRTALKSKFWCVWQR